eukprot:GHVH01003749.1.p1 GENE.GHVH01003749.1~~GHVH01003749.1.p1  ORF type:complete len:131 (+),score=18.80 GHVH01003749.1:470-862(+)
MEALASICQLCDHETVLLVIKKMIVDDRYSQRYTSITCTLAGWTLDEWMLGGSTELSRDLLHGLLDELEFFLDAKQTNVRDEVRRVVVKIGNAMQVGLGRSDVSVCRSPATLINRLVPKATQIVLVDRPL